MTLQASPAMLIINRNAVQKVDKATKYRQDEQKRLAQTIPRTYNYGNEYNSTNKQSTGTLKGTENVIKVSGLGLNLSRTLIPTSGAKLPGI